MLSEPNLKMNADSELWFQRLGSIALCCMPLCYVVMFVIFGVMLDIPQSDVLNDKITYIASNQTMISVAYIIGYLVFGCLLLIAVQAIHSRLTIHTSHLLNSASIFGVIWVVLMMCSGMTALVGMNTMISLNSQASQSAETLFLVYTTMTNALGGGIELVGGVWVFLLSIAAMRSHQLPRALCLFGAMVGILGVLTLYQALPVLKDLFGISQVIWFVWSGIVTYPKTSTGNTV